MSERDPIAELEHLEGQLRSAHESYYSWSQQLAGFEADLQKLDARRLEAYRALAVQEDGAEREVGRVENERDKLLVIRERTQVSFKGADSARVQTEHHIAELRKRELEAFKTKAEKVSERAAGAWKALEGPYREAEAAWRAAEAEWSPLRPALEDEIRTTDAEAGVYLAPKAIQAAATTPGFPLPNAASVFSGAVAARPKGGEVEPEPEWD